MSNTDELVNSLTIRTVCTDRESGSRSADTVRTLHLFNGLNARLIAGTNPGAKRTT